VYTNPDHVFVLYCCFVSWPNYPLPSVYTRVHCTALVRRMANSQWLSIVAYILACTHRLRIKALELFWAIRSTKVRRLSLSSHRSNEPHYSHPHNAAATDGSTCKHYTRCVVNLPTNHNRIYGLMYTSVSVPPCLPHTACSGYGIYMANWWRIEIVSYTAVIGLYALDIICSRGWRIPWQWMQLRNVKLYV